VTGAPIRLAAALVAVAAFAAAGCGDDTASPPTSSSTTSVAPTTTAGPASTSEPGPATTAALPCPADVSVPAAASAVTEAGGDVDGDGAEDALRTFLLADRWVLQIEVAAGGGAELDLGGSDQGGMGLVGAADVDGDQRDETWVRVGSGASTVILGLVGFVDCTLVRVRFERGEPVELPVGGSVGATAGIECRADDADADLTTFAAFHREDQAYEVTATRWALVDRVLVERSSSTSELEADDPDFLRATSFTCHDLAL